MLFVECELIEFEGHVRRTSVRRAQRSGGGRSPRSSETPAATTRDKAHARRPHPAPGWKSERRPCVTPLACTCINTCVWDSNRRPISNLLMGRSLDAKGCCWKWACLAYFRFHNPHQRAESNRFSAGQQCLAGCLGRFPQLVDQRGVASSTILYVYALQAALSSTGPRTSSGMRRPACRIRLA